MISFDIETIGRPDAMDYLDRRAFRPHSRLKDPKKIQDNIEQKRQAAKDKAALRWWLGQVVCISAVTDTGGLSFCEAGMDELELLNKFSAWVAEVEHGDSFFGKNSENFDRPYLIGRHLAHSIPVPWFLKKIDHPRDVDHIFAFSSRCDQIGTLDDYAFGMGMEGKIADSGDVGQMVKDGKWKELKGHCLRDSHIAMEMMRRYTSA